MKPIKVLYIILLLLLMSACGTGSRLDNSAKSSKGTAEARENFARYPYTIPGYEKFVLYVDPLKNEPASKIEIIPGKYAQVDCNQHTLLGKLREEIVSGYGFRYYVFESKGDIASTRIGCPDNKLAEQFVIGESILADYNSRLPVVVFVPEGMSVQYRIWQAGNTDRFPVN